MWPPPFLMTHNQPNDDNDNCHHITTGKKRPNKLRVSCSNVFLIVFHFTNNIFLSFNDNEIRGRCLKVSSMAGAGGEMEEMRTLTTKMKMKMMTTRLETRLHLEPQVSFFLSLFILITFIIVSGHHHLDASKLQPYRGWQQGQRGGGQWKDMGLEMQMCLHLEPRYVFLFYFYTILMFFRARLHAHQPQPVWQTNGHHHYHHLHDKWQKRPKRCIDNVSLGYRWRELYSRNFFCDNHWLVIGICLAINSYNAVMIM